jgi:hypothetical protein
MRPCWEFFDCPQKYRGECPVYLKHKMSNVFFEGWLEPKIDSTIGGPAKRGPCCNCEIFKKRYPDISESINTYFKNVKKI